MAKHEKDTEYFLMKGRQVLAVIIQDLGGIPGEVELPARIRWAITIRHAMGLPLRVPKSEWNRGSKVTGVMYDLGFKEYVNWWFASSGPAQKPQLWPGFTQLGPIKNLSQALDQGSGKVEPGSGSGPSFKTTIIL
jgi:hypothetical protein